MGGQLGGAEGFAGRGIGVSVWGIVRIGVGERECSRHSTGEK